MIPRQLKFQLIHPRDYFPLINQAKQARQTSRASGKEESDEDFTRFHQ
jgi:hypothetical protein